MAELPSTVSRDAADSPWRLLLERLDLDPARANEAYRSLRDRLIAVLRWRDLPEPEDLADEAFDRTVARLATGERIDNIAAFVFGVANRLSMEAGRRASRHERLDDASEPREGAFAAPLTCEQVGELASEQGRLECLEQCLDDLPRASRDLIVCYHHGRGRARIARRQRLAQDLGIGLNALRIRMHRLHGRLQVCIDRCRDAPAHKDAR